MKAEFEEKQYEIAASIELASGDYGSRVFSSGQVLEGILGYDSAADPSADHLLWKILELPRPKGVVLIPRYWRGGEKVDKAVLPQSAVSMILQFKRPQYMLHGNAAQWNLWKRPFFRFERQSSQHAVLSRLEKALGNGALVRYASPAFYSYGALEKAQLLQEVLLQTGFASPSDIGSHKVWTYIEPGVDGRANPSGNHKKFERISELFESLDAIGPGQPSDEVAIRNMGTAQMATALRYRRPAIRRLIDRWILTVEQAGYGLPSTMLESLRDYATVQSTVHRVGASWWLVASKSSAK